MAHFAKVIDGIVEQVIVAAKTPVPALFETKVSVIQPEVFNEVQVTIVPCN